MTHQATLATHPAHWRRPWRIGLQLAVTLACFATGLALYVEDRNTLKLAAQYRRTALQDELRALRETGDTLGTLRNTENALARQFDAEEEPLWPAGDGPALLQTRLAAHATESGLALESFRPHDATAVTARMLPASPLQPGKTSRPAARHQAEIGLSGDYAQLLRFIESATAAPRPVNIDRLSITRTERDGLPTLLMQATVSSVPRTAGLADAANDADPGSGT